MRAAVLTFPGSNCDYDCYKAVTDVLGESADFVWHRDRPSDGAGLRRYDLVILPGGFSYGDYLRAGAIARFSPIMDDVIDAARDGLPVLGICNGFQILCEAGLLPGALVRNRGLKFLGRDTLVRVENASTLYTHRYDVGQVLKLPLAHGEGNYQADEKTVRRLESEGRVVFRYVDAEGDASEEGNPNGSIHNIAGIVNEAGNVMGMMPHPERVADPLLGGTDGRALFESIRDRVHAASGTGQGPVTAGRT